MKNDIQFSFKASQWSKSISFVPLMSIVATLKKKETPRAPAKWIFSNVPILGTGKIDDKATNLNLGRLIEFVLYGDGNGYFVLDKKPLKTDRLKNLFIMIGEHVYPVVMKSPTKIKYFYEVDGELKQAQTPIRFLFPATHLKPADDFVNVKIQIIKSFCTELSLFGFLYQYAIKDEQVQKIKGSNVIYGEGEPKPVKFKPELRQELGFTTIDVMPRKDNEEYMRANQLAYERAALELSIKGLRCYLGRLLLNDDMLTYENLVNAYDCAIAGLKVLVSLTGMDLISYKAEALLKPAPNPNVNLKKEDEAIYCYEHIQALMEYLARLQQILEVLRLDSQRELFSLSDYLKSAAVKLTYSFRNLGTSAFRLLASSHELRLIEVEEKRK